MALETTTYIDGLVTTNPTAADPKSQGDDHIRLIKSALKATFPLFTGAVAATHTALNYIANVTSDIQAQLNSKGAIAGQVWAGYHDFTASVITAYTQALGNISTRVATTEFAMTMQSPSFSGVPTAPTALTGANTSQIATTSFVMNTAFGSVLLAQPANNIYLSQQFGGF
jgi:hypothetical protein